MRRILVIAAHPDDEVLGCGATISKYTRHGATFMVLYVAEGSSCRYSNPICDDSLAAIAARKKQAIAALSLFSIHAYHFADLPCGRLDQHPIIQINQTIEKAIQEFDPDTVFTHSGLDANNDHRIVFRASIMATRPSSNHKVSRLLSYEVLSSSEWAYGEPFAPNVFEEIDERDLSLKWRALSAYESEIRSYPFPRSEVGIRSQALMRGMQAGVKLAEAFCLIREFRV